MPGQVNAPEVSHRRPNIKDQTEVDPQEEPEPSLALIRRLDPPHQLAKQLSADSKRDGDIDPPRLQKEGPDQSETDIGQAPDHDLRNRDCRPTRDGEGGEPALAVILLEPKRQDPK